ncbi:MAG TPA: hypothetical protein VGD62_11385, partial [Acidobacteriaceae bacterium]
MATGVTSDQVNRPASLRLPSNRALSLVALALLVILALQLFASVRQESPTFDEPAHLFAGVAYWTHGDFGRNPEHPPLVKLIAALPILSMGLPYPPPVP